MPSGRPRIWKPVVGLLQHADVEGAAAEVVHRDPVADADLGPGGVLRAAASGSEQARTELDVGQRGDLAQQVDLEWPQFAG